MKLTSQSRASLVLTVVLLMLFGGAVVCLHRLELMRADVRHEDALYIPSAKVLKRMSLGYSGLMADLYWTRAVQYFGWKHKRREMEYPLLYPLLDITTELDPNLTVAYRFGAPFLAQKPPNGAGEPDKAVELIERGIQRNPDDWHLYYDLGFLHSMERHDYVAASAAFERGSQVPGAHPFLKVLAASMAQHGGDIETARMLWSTTLNTTDDKSLKQNAEQHLRALDVDEIVPKLEEIVRIYRDKTGIQPTSFGQLVAAGYLRRVPLDPIGLPYKIRPDGRVEVQDPDELPFIQKGLPPDYKPRVPGVP